MMTAYRRVVPGLGLCVLLLGSRTEARQTFNVDVSGGYSFLADATASLAALTARPRMSGWAVDVSPALTRRLRVVLAADGATGTQATVSAYGINNTWTDRSLLAGLRWSYGGSTRARPYWQVLAGTFSNTLDYTGYSSRTQLYERHAYRESTVAIQPGAGFDLTVAPRVSLRLGVDVKYLVNFDWIDRRAGSSMLRIGIGSVVRLGRT